MDQAASPNCFTNYRKLISLADRDWEIAEAGKIAALDVEIKSANRMVDQYGREFHHFCTTSYLGLDHHPDLLDGAVAALREIGTLRVANSKNRCKLAILEQSIGAGRASIKLHTTSEFAAAQNKLQLNIGLFDSLVDTNQYGSNIPIRLIHCGEAARANRLSIELANHGFFTSAVFFPVVAQHHAAIRITLRADMDPSLIQRFCELANELIHLG